MQGRLGWAESPPLGAKEQVAYVHILWMAFPGEGQALSCSWFELDSVLLLR